MANRLPGRLPGRLTGQPGRLPGRLAGQPGRLGVSSGGLAGRLGALRPLLRAFLPPKVGLKGLGETPRATPGEEEPLSEHFPGHARIPCNPLMTPGCRAVSRPNPRSAEAHDSMLPGRWGEVTDAGLAANQFWRQSTPLPDDRTPQMRAIRRSQGSGLKANFCSFFIASANHCFWGNF
jgi:hypothetical protein